MIMCLRKGMSITHCRESYELSREDQNSVLYGASHLLSVNIFLDMRPSRYYNF